MAGHSRRHTFVNLSVVAGSAAMFAAAWAGIVHADRQAAGASLSVQAGVPVTPALSVASAQATVVSTAAAPTASTPTVTEVPASAPVRQVVVVRRSRAS